MFSQTPRKAAAALFLATALTLSCAAPSQAAFWGQPHRGAEDPARTEPGRGLIAFLLHIVAFAGGAMDPNGAH